MARTEPISVLREAVPQSKLFQPDGPITFESAHGALDVLGSLNADFGGTLAQMTLPPRAAVAVQLLDEPVLRVRNPQIAPPLGDTEVTIDLSDGAIEKLPLAAGWAAPIVALFTGVRPSPGAAIQVHSEIPLAAGQAGTTAVLCAIARALLSADGPPAPLTVAQAVAHAMTPGTPAEGPGRGHLMNALTAIHVRAPKPELLRYSAQPHRLVGAVPLPDDVHILALDTGVRYAAPLLRAALDELRIAAAMGYRIIETIYKDLGRDHTPLQGYLANTSPLLYRQYFRALLPRRLRGADFLRTYGGFAETTFPAAAQMDPAGVYRVRTAVDHLIAENEHAEQFLQAMEELADASGQPQDVKARAEKALILARAGRLLLASHHSYRLRLELSCREADWLIDHLMEAGPERGIYGARITRGGGGGTVAALLSRSGEATDALLETLRAYHQMTGLTLGITEA